MLTLPAPATDARDDLTVKAICKDAAWTPHEATWLAAYAGYRRHRANPFKITPALFTPDVSVEQRRLYDTRGGAGPIARIRAALDLACCAMCGSHHNGTLDHYLPRRDWPEFSIMQANLVPACSLCNSGAKGIKTAGALPHQRFLHPYYDKAARKPLWRVRIHPPMAAPDFEPVALPSLGKIRKVRVEFHLAEIMGDQFAAYAAAQWKRLPEVLRVETGPTPPVITVKAALRSELRRSRLAFGVNGWRTALLRGVIADPVAIARLHHLLKR